MIQMQRKKDLFGKPIYGEKLKILVVNDQESSVRYLFQDVINGSRITGIKTAEDALKLIETNKKRGEPFNVILIDKNLGGFGQSMYAQALIDNINKISPESHICIHSAESGPGQFGRFPFISITSDLNKIITDIKNFIVKVEQKPFRATPARINLSVLARPIPILTAGGTIRVVRAVEGDKLPQEAQGLISEGGRILNITQAIKMGDKISKPADRTALYEERDRVSAFIQTAKKARTRKKQLLRRQRLI